MTHQEAIALKMRIRSEMPLEVGIRLAEELTPQRFIALTVDNTVVATFHDEQGYEKLLKFVSLAALWSPVLLGIGE